MPGYPRSPRSLLSKFALETRRGLLLRRRGVLAMALLLLPLLSLTANAQTTVPTDATSATTAASSASSSGAGGCLCKLIDPSHWEQVKQCFCKTAAGQMVNAMSMPVTTFSGGIIPPFCPTGPSAEDLAKDGAAGAAAAIAADKASAPERVAAVEYLGTVDCHYYVSAEGALIAALRTDKCDCVRWAAARVLGSGCCCTPKTIEALKITVERSNKDGNPSETSPRVIAAAQIALTNCMFKAPAPTPVQPESPGAPPSASPPPATTGLWPIPESRVAGFVSDYYARLDYDQPAGAAIATPAAPVTPTVPVVSQERIVAQHIATEATETVPQTGRRGLVNILMHNFNKGSAGNSPPHAGAQMATANAVPPAGMQPPPGLQHSPPLQPSPVHQPGMPVPQMQPAGGSSPQQPTQPTDPAHAPVRALAESMQGAFRSGPPHQPARPPVQPTQHHPAKVQRPIPAGQPRVIAPPAELTMEAPAQRRPSRPSYPVLAPPRHAGGAPAVLVPYDQATPIDPRTGTAMGSNPAEAVPPQGTPMPLGAQTSIEHLVRGTPPQANPQPQQHARVPEHVVEAVPPIRQPQSQSQQPERLRVPSDPRPNGHPASRPPRSTNPQARPLPTQREPIPAAPEPPALGRRHPPRALPADLVAHPMQSARRPEPIPPIEYVRPRVSGDIIRTSY